MEPRPKRYDERIYQAVAAALAESLDVKELDLFRAMKSSISLDGYYLAKELDRMGYGVDAGFVERLTSVEWHADNEHRRLTGEWVKQNSIMPAFKIGDAVTVIVNQEMLKGEIVNVTENLAHYTVACASKGHVKEGIGTHGYVMNYEDVKERHATS